MQLVHRKRELDSIDALLARSRDTGGLLLIEGRPGYGKTALVGEARSRAERARLTALHVAGAELEHDVDFELVARLLGERPRGSRKEALTAAYSSLCERGPALLIVDDLQWADPASLRFLDFVLQRGQHRILAVGLGARAASPEAAKLLVHLETRADQALYLEPLDQAAAEELVRSRDPELRDEEVAARVHACAGNPLLLAETASAGGTLPVRIVQWVQLRLGRLPEPCHALAAAVALLGPEYATTGRTAALTGLPAGEVANAADALAAAALLEPGDAMRFAEPLVADAVLGRLPAAALNRTKLDAAHMLAADGAPPEIVGKLLLGAPRLADAQIVQMLRAAAADASARGDHAAAASYLARALEEPPPPAERGELTLALAEAEAMAGSLGALDRFESALRLAHRPEGRAEALTGLGWRLYQVGRPSDARQAFEHALAEADVGDRLRTEAQIAARVLGAFDGAWAFEEMHEYAEAALRSGEVGDGKQAVVAAVAAVFADVDAGLANAAALQSLAALGPADSGLDVLIGSCAMSALIWSDSLDAVDPVLAALVAGAEASGDPHALAYVRFGRSWTRYWRGDVRGAADDVLFAVELWLGDWNAQLPTGAWWAARCLIELGDPAQANTVLDQATRPTGIPDPLQSGYLAAGRLHVAIATGRWRDARRQIAVLEPNPTAWFKAAAVNEWQPDAAIALARAGEREHALELAHSHLEAARQFGAARTLGAALRALGVIEGGERSLELLSAAVSVLDESPSRLELIRALVDQGALLRSLGKRSHARAALKRAIELAAPTTADALRERARAELAMTGGAPGGEQLTGPAALTPSERRVAELAAAGRSNPDIAAELFVSRKTVEFHLSNAFRKLEVGSREELLGALGQG